MFDAEGYLKITDFGIARVWTLENSHDTSGTPGYMAPEVMCRQNHGVATDYFALGVIVYECMLGKRPYQGRTRKEIRDHILAKQAIINLRDLPYGWSIEAIDLVNKVYFKAMIIALTKKTHSTSRFEWARRGEETSLV